MATRYGNKTLNWLIERGWEEAPASECSYGDRQVIDHKTKKEMTVYQAAELQKERTGEYPDFLPK